MTLRLVSLSCLVLLVALSADRGHAAMAGDNAESSVRTVLRQEAYPWYDSQSDEVNPLVTEQPTWVQGLGDRLKSFFEWLGKLWGRLPRGPRVDWGTRFQRSCSRSSVLPCSSCSGGSGDFTSPGRPGRAMPLSTWGRSPGWRGWRLALFRKMPIPGPRRVAAPRATSRVL